MDRRCAGGKTHQGRRSGGVFDSFGNYIFADFWSCVVAVCAPAKGNRYMAITAAINDL